MRANVKDVNRQIKYAYRTIEDNIEEAREETNLLTKTAAIEIAKFENIGIVSDMLAVAKDTVEENIKIFNHAI